MKVIIHIGVPKTGTSAIQSHLGTNRNWLLDRGVYVPESGFQTGHGHGMLFSLHDTEDPPGNLRPWLSTRGQLPALEEEIERISEQAPEKVLLSWEGFALLDSTLLDKFCTALAGHELEVLCYVRNQARLWNSQLGQSIKLGRTPADELLKYAMTGAVKQCDHFDFDALLSRWANAMGTRGQIRTRVFQRSLLVGGNIVTDFLDALGIRDLTGFALQPGNINESLDLASTAILALCEEAGIDQRQRHRLVSALLRASGYEASASERPGEEFEDGFATSNRALMEHFPPENADRGDVERELLEQPPPMISTADSTVALCNAAIAAIRARETTTWTGGVLQGHQLSDVTNLVAPGWRDSEANGIWSIGERSRIAFKLPAVPLESGPTELRLEFRGRYLGSNQTTRVVGSGIEQQFDLSNCDIRVPITGELLERGVELELIHEAPVSPAELGIGKSADKLAFMLQLLYYQFEGRRD